MTFMGFCNSQRLDTIRQKTKFNLVKIKEHIRTYTSN